MLFTPKPLGRESLPADTVKKDSETAEKFERCALSEKAIYIGGALVANGRYIPLAEVERVFKRLAVTKGFFDGKKVFAAIPYLVVVYGGGREKQVRFDREDQLNLLLEAVKTKTDIPVGKNIK